MPDYRIKHLLENGTPIYSKTKKLIRPFAPAHVPKVKNVVEITYVRGLEQGSEKVELQPEMMQMQQKEEVPIPEMVDDNALLIQEG